MDNRNLNGDKTSIPPQCVYNSQAPIYLMPQIPVEILNSFIFPQMSGQIPCFYVPVPIIGAPQMFPLQGAQEIVQP